MRKNIRGAKSDGCPLLGVIVVNEPDSEPIIYLR